MKPHTLLLTCTTLMMLVACSAPPAVSLPPERVMTQPTDLERAIVRFDVGVSLFNMGILRSTARGIGVAIDDGSYLTAGHVIHQFKLHDVPYANIRITPLADAKSSVDPDETPEQSPYHATVSTYSEHDIARVHIDPYVDTPRVMSIAPRFPGIRKTAYVVLPSVGREGEYERLKSTIIGRSYDKKVFLLVGTGMRGDSGAPVCDEQGRLIGLVIGGNNGEDGTPQITIPFEWQNTPHGPVVIPSWIGRVFTQPYIICTDVTRNFD